jgi:type II secretory pathway component PulL
LKTSPPNSCNLLSLEAGNRRLWRFSTSGGQANLTTEQNGAASTQIPQRIVGKDWRTLIVPKLNVAWLPLDQVFLRVVQLPKCDYTELVAMLEFQLEKLSPLPVAQVMWSAEVIPSQSNLPSELQTVLLLIVSRDNVEEFLGQLESKGFLADQLEIPFLNQLLATKVTADGACLYLVPFGGKMLAMAAWWYGGVLQNLNLMHLSGPENFAAEAGAQLTETGWAGELEGWMTSPPSWKLVAEPEMTAPWQAAFQAWAGKPVEVAKALPEAELAKLSAQRVARGENRVNLLPQEFTARYRQQLIDRVWMRGLGLLLLLYIVGVLSYLGSVSLLKLKQIQRDKEVEALKGDYTKALRTKARIQVMRNQASLKYAALDVWRSVTTELPEQLILTSVSFSKGRNITLTGYASEATKVTDYYEALLKLKRDDEAFFTRVDLRPSRTGNGPFGAVTTIWSVECELKGAEIE